MKRSKAAHLFQKRRVGEADRPKRPVFWYTFCDKGVSDGVSLNVVRDKAGNIEKLVSVDKGELEQFVK